MRIRKKLIMLPIAVMSIVLPSLGQTQGQDTANQDKTQKKDTSETRRANAAVQPGAKVPQPKDAGAIPANAVRIDASHFRAKDDKGVTWNYTKTPFGVVKYRAADEPKSASTPEASALGVPNWKVKDLGDSVRFEKATPFGPSVWTKKKSDLDAEEKLALAKAIPPPADSGSSKAGSESTKK
ncbi:MAG TPA: hypothetical protein VHZ07_26730 [Bryobacteraceae bacterium]|jgi:hypothetical protein|nr:hypothetical protein [Bryobacteraceae bacterium]